MLQAECCGGPSDLEVDVSCLDMIHLSYRGAIYHGPTQPIFTKQDPPQSQREENYKIIPT